MDTEEWKEANVNSEEKKQELSRQIELGSVFGGLAEILNSPEEDKNLESKWGSRRNEKVGTQFPTIEEEEGIGCDFGSAISGDSGNDGVGHRIQNSRKTTLMKRRSGTMSWMVVAGWVWGVWETIIIES